VYNQFVFFLRLGGSYLAMFVFPALVFMAWRLLSSFASEPRATARMHARIIGRFALILVGVAAILSLSLYLSAILATLPPARLAAASDWCSNLDRVLFTVDVPFWFQQDGSTVKLIMDKLGFILIWAYVALTPLMALAINITLALHFQTFLRLSASFIAVIFLSLPIWYMCPALIPAERYLDNILSINPPTAITQSIAAYKPSETLKAFQTKMRVTRVGPTQGVTTMPSMHVAWAFIIAFFLSQLSRKTLLFTVPYNLLNAVAAIYTLEHYAIDILAGALVAALAIALVNRFVVLRSKERQITDLIQENSHQLYPKLRALLRRT
jgi:membrane-associated phospholipid phosphatase